MTGREIRRTAWAAAKGRRVLLVLYDLIAQAPSLIVLLYYGPQGGKAARWLLPLIEIGYVGMIRFGLIRILMDLWAGKRAAVNRLWFAFTGGRFRTCLTVSFALWLAPQIINYLTDGFYYPDGPGWWIGRLLNKLLSFLWFLISFPVCYRVVLREKDKAGDQLREGLKLGRVALWETAFFYVWLQLPLWACARILGLFMFLFPGARILFLLVQQVFSFIYLPYQVLAMAGFAQNLVDPAPVEELPPPRPMKLSGKGGGWYWCSLSEGPEERA